MLAFTLVIEVNTSKHNHQRVFMDDSPNFDACAYFGD